MDICIRRAVGWVFWEGFYGKGWWSGFHGGRSNEFGMWEHGSIATRPLVVNTPIGTVANAEGCVMCFITEKKLAKKWRAKTAYNALVDLKRGLRRNGGMDIL